MILEFTKRLGMVSFIKFISVISVDAHLVQGRNCVSYICKHIEQIKTTNYIMDPHPAILTDSTDSGKGGLVFDLIEKIYIDYIIIISSTL